MEALWQSFVEWFMSLGDKYGVNPIVFGSIYVGAIPFFTLALGWIVRNYRKGKSIALPVLLAGFFFVSAYLYLFIAGHNIPWWVYALLGAMIVYGAYSTFTSTKQKARKAAQEEQREAQNT